MADFLALLFAWLTSSYVLGVIGNSPYLFSGATLRSASFPFISSLVSAMGWITVFYAVLALWEKQWDTADLRQFVGIAFVALVPVIFLFRLFAQRTQYPIR